MTIAEIRCGVVEKPQILPPRDTKDFGSGFYCTPEVFNE